MTTKPTWTACKNGALYDILTTGPGCATDDCDCGDDGHQTFAVATGAFAAAARLIAAAPDLLAVVKMLAADYSLLDGRADAGSTAGLVRAAIAKAEGE